MLCWYQWYGAVGSGLAALEIGRSDSQEKNLISLGQDLCPHVHGFSANTCSVMHFLWALFCLAEVSPTWASSVSCDMVWYQNNHVLLSKPTTDVGNYFATDGIRHIKNHHSVLRGIIKQGEWSRFQLVPGHCNASKFCCATFVCINCTTWLICSNQHRTLWVYRSTWTQSVWHSSTSQITSLTRRAVFEGKKKRKKEAV